MNRTLLRGAALGALLLCSTLAARPAAAQLPFLGGGPKASSGARHVAVYTLVGDVEVVPSDGGQTEVAGRFRGPHRRRLELAVSRGRVAVDFRGDRVVAPAFARTRTVGLGRNGEFLPVDGADRVVTLASGGDGTRASADLEIDLPPGRSVTVHLYAGRVRLGGTAEQAETRGEPLRVRVENVDGRLRMERLDG